jgi:hypothetical protein
MTYQPRSGDSMALTILQRLAITAEMRGKLYSALGKTTKDDLPLFEVLEKMEGEFIKTKHPLGPLVTELLFRLRGLGSDRSRSGGRRTLGTELRGLVPDGEAMLIQSGVLSGNMSGGLFNAADLVAKQGRLFWAAVGSLITPAGYLAGLIGLFVFYSVKIFPGIQRGRPRTKWPPDAQAFGWVADHIWYLTFGIVGFLVVGGIALAIVAPRWTGLRREFVDRHIFPFTLIASVNGSSLLTSLAGYISAGIPISDAITNIRAGSNNYLRWQCDKMAGVIGTGARAEAALTELSVIQRQYHWIIKVYGMSGDATQAYHAISEEMATQTEAFIRRLFDRVIKNILLLLVGFAIAWVLMAMQGIVDSGTKKYSDSGASDAAVVAAFSFAAPNSLSGGFTHVSAS